MRYIFFSTENCPSCRVVEKWLEGYEIERVKLSWGDSFIGQYGLSSVPTILKLNNGKEVDRLEGMHTKAITLKFLE